jgi:hypothetical protein
MAIQCINMSKRGEEGANMEHLPIKQIIKIF